MPGARPDRSPGLLRLLAEVRAPLEAASLLPALPILMRGPRGDGHHVVTIPPFGAGDAFTTVLRAYLGRTGYSVHKWGRAEILAFHRLQKIAVRRLSEVADEAGGPVSLIGHSLGGIYAREVARAAPEYVRRVITVGSPFAGDLKSNVVWPMYESVTGTRITSIPADTMARLNEPLPMPSTAVYSRSDGVVAWHACIDIESPLAENIEVPGSHIGLLHNPAVLYVIADRLAQAPGVHEPFDTDGLARLVAKPGPVASPQGPAVTAMRAVDAAFLAMERPNEPRHHGSLMIFGPSVDGPLDRAAVHAALVARLGRMSTARLVVVESPNPFSRPSWRVADNVDLDVHLRHSTLPTGVDARVALESTVAGLHAIHLDRSRPLWQLHVIDGLPEHHVAVYAKVHMAALDDATGVELMTALLDDDPAGRPTMDEAEVQLDAGTNAFVDRLVGSLPDQVRRAAGFPVRLAGRTGRALGDQLPGFGVTAREVVRRWPGLEGVARHLANDVDGIDDGREHPTGRAPRLSFNEPIGSHRAFAIGSAPIEQLLAVRAAANTGAAPVSFNAVVLAVCTGALRRWMLANDELPTSPIVAVVPVLVKGRRDTDAHVAGIMLALPTHLADPARRLEQTAVHLERAKQRHVEMPASLAQDIAMFAPPAIAGMVNRINDAMPHRRFVSPTVNIGITNVPGPQRPVYLAGRPLVSSHPVLTVSDITPLHLGVQAGSSALGFGAIADADTIEDLDGLLDAVGIELAELSAAYAPRRRARKRS